MYSEIVHVHTPSSCPPTRREGRDVGPLDEDNSTRPLAEAREPTDCPSQPVGACELGGEHVLPINCEHFERCAGCVVNSCQNPPELYTPAKEYFASKWQIDLGFAQGACRSWRTRAKLAVRAPNEIGLFRKGTHQVLSIPHCQVHHPQINEAVQRLKKALGEYSAYDERTHKGDLRYIQLVVERASGKVQLSLVLNMPTPSYAWRSTAKSLFEDPFWHSIWLNCNDKPHNCIFGSYWEHVAGQEVVWEMVAGNHIAFGPSHFGQANLEMFEAMILDIQTLLPPDAIVCELYAGIGAIGLSLAEKSRQVRLCEREPHAETYFAMAKSRLDLKVQQKLSYLVGKAEECLRLLQGADVAIVDPPRKGLGKELLRKLLREPTLKQIIYISCDWLSLERDLEVLREEESSKVESSWKVAYAKSFLFFPGTNQIETLAVIEKGV